MFPHTHMAGNMQVAACGKIGDSPESLGFASLSTPPHSLDPVAAWASSLVYGLAHYVWISFLYTKGFRSVAAWCRTCSEPVWLSP